MDTEQEFFADNYEFLAERDGLYLGPDMLEQLSQTMRGEPGTFGSTPFNPYLASIADQQRAIAKQHGTLLKAQPKNVREPLASELVDFNSGRLVHRMEKNFESFEHREHYDFSIIPDEMREVAQRVLTGHGSPAENIVIADILGMPTVELASTSHFYGNPKRMKILTPHRTAVEECIAFYDGILIASQVKPHVASGSRTDDFQIKNGYRNTSYNRAPELSDVFPMTRTRLIGLVKKYRIYERSSFLLDVTKLDPELVDSIQAVDANEPNRLEHILGTPNFYATVKKILDSNQYDIGVPVATTTWAVHTERNTKLRTNRELRMHHTNRARPEVHDTPFDAHYELLGLN